jgi:hypothetical protein
VTWVVLRVSWLALTALFVSEFACLAGLRARVSRLGGFTRPFSGLLFPPSGARLFVITGEAATNRSRSSPIMMGRWSAKYKIFT